MTVSDINSAPDQEPAVAPARATATWSTLIGHQRARQWIGTAIRSGRLAGSFLLVGPHGIGKRTIAALIAKTLLCERVAASEMAPCNACPACVQVDAGTHPDVVRVARPKDKTLIPLELLIGPPDARMQAGFCRDIRLRPTYGKHRVAILEDADFLNEEGANCLLKTLEEPPASATILVIGTNEQRQLPTIRSRCQIIRLGSLSAADATRLLRDIHQVGATDEQIADAIDICGGDIKSTLRFLSEESSQLYDSLTKLYSVKHPDPLALTRLISSHVDEAGKEASVRRDAMRDVFSISVEHFRRQLRREVFDSVAQPATMARLDRSIRALREVDRSANQSTLIECFAADIATATTGDRGDIG